MIDAAADPIQEARQPLIDAVAQAFAVYGWPEVAGRLYAHLYLAGRPVTQDDLCEKLGVSKATISTTLRSLEHLHLVHRVGSASVEGGGRPRLFFEAERDFMRVVQELLRHNARRELDVMTRGLEGSRARLEALATDADTAIAGQARIDLEAVAHFDGYRRWASRILWLVQSGERMQRFLTSFWGEKNAGVAEPEP